MANRFGTLAGTHLCDSAEALRAFAASLAPRLDAGDLVALDGPLGVGKTEFVKGLAEGLGCAEMPSSPTFAVAHEYECARGTLFHFDFFRMESPGELDTCGFWESLEAGIVAAEWAGKFEKLLPRGSVRVGIAVKAKGAREIRLR